MTQTQSPESITVAEMLILYIRELKAKGLWELPKEQQALRSLKILFGSRFIKDMDDLCFLVALGKCNDGQERSVYAHSLLRFAGFCNHGKIIKEDVFLKIKSQLGRSE